MDEFNGYDLSQPNEAPGNCCKCHGTGIYRWGKKAGTCFSCRGTGKQDRTQIKRNVAYNVHKATAIMRADFRRTDRTNDVRDPGEDAADRWNETHGDRY